MWQEINLLCLFLWILTLFHTGKTTFNLNHTDLIRTEDHFVVALHAYYCYFVPGSWAGWLTWAAYTYFPKYPKVIENGEPKSVGPTKFPQQKRESNSNTNSSYWALMVNITLFMPVRVQSLMVFPPLRGFCHIITGCIIPVPYDSFGVPNTCSYPLEVQLPHVYLFTSRSLVPLPTMKSG